MLGINTVCCTVCIPYTHSMVHSGCNRETNVPHMFSLWNIFFWSTTKDLGPAYIHWAILVATCDFHSFLCGTLNLFQGKIPSLLAISKICDYKGAIFKTNVIKCYIFFEEIIVCLTRAGRDYCRKWRLSSQVAIGVKQCTVKCMGK